MARRIADEVLAPHRALLLEAASPHLLIGQTVPDTGDTRGDLEAAARQLVKALSEPVAAQVVLALIGRIEPDSSVRATFLERGVYPWQTSLREAIRRGIARGDLPETTDVELMSDMLAGTVLQRTLAVAKPRTRGLAKKVVRLLMDGAAAADAS